MLQSTTMVSLLPPPPPCHPTIIPTDIFAPASDRSVPQYHHLQSAPGPIGSCPSRFSNDYTSSNRTLGTENPHRPFKIGSGVRKKVNFPTSNLQPYTRILATQTPSYLFTTSQCHSMDTSGTRFNPSPTSKLSNCARRRWVFPTRARR